ncbi:maleylpyruvate isomerase N-terminal domain-containing protein [Streptomyces prunicolor]|uniref:Maleylpyruvate isomerase N-terminal domain-containing protein n=1 Tax=Streptomyces prunicolor TaxID=67348 RepID=A0ABU4F6K1_9ACTN|nr:maleylpyruvate isomerase N-terminal domain-containing protein [Streptomyces prunicolor]MDV7214910.1 maleylpyruvate isomerase N-terminal domain-containing protein [Streptomyces prunicolor]
MTGVSATERRLPTRCPPWKLSDLPAHVRVVIAWLDAALINDFNATWQQVDRLCRAEPEGRVVRTRHGDPMLLSEFLLTRVVEGAVHGLDLADALRHEPWPTFPGRGIGAGSSAQAGWTRIGIRERPSGHAGALTACLNQVASICQPITPVAPLAPSTSMRNDLGAAIRCSTTD